jgi:hypothetical protein
MQLRIGNPYEFERITAAVTEFEMKFVDSMIARDALGISTLKMADPRQ